MAPSPPTVATWLYIENDGDEYSLWVQQTATGGKAQVVPPQPWVLTHLAFSPGGE